MDPLLTRVKEVVTEVDRWFDGWCPTATCCAESGKAVHERVASLRDELDTIPDIDTPALVTKLRKVAVCVYLATERSIADDIAKTCHDAATALEQTLPAPVPPTYEEGIKAVAFAMRKVLPPALMAEVTAHLDPLTPFLSYLREFARDQPPR